LQSTISPNGVIKCIHVLRMSLPELPDAVDSDCDFFLQKFCEMTTIVIDRVALGARAPPRAEKTNFGHNLWGKGVSAPPGR